MHTCCKNALTISECVRDGGVMVQVTVEGRERIEPSEVNTGAVSGEKNELEG